MLHARAVIRIFSLRFMLNIGLSLPIITWMVGTALSGAAHGDITVITY